MGAYESIFKRRSFHRFPDHEPLTDADMQAVREAIAAATPLDPTIQTKIVMCPEAETSCHCGAEYCLLFYSEDKPGYLQNIGYIGEQIDLMLVEQGIGTLWYGFGKIDEKRRDNLSFVIMIAIAKAPQDAFRQNMFAAKRKSVRDGWQGDTLGVAGIVRFAPSACNTQPWLTVCEGDTLTVYRSKKAGKYGLLPARLLTYFNRIDIGIYLYMLEVCLRHEGFAFVRELPDKAGDGATELAAVYRDLKRQQEGTIARITRYEGLMKKAEAMLASGDPDAGELQDITAALSAYYSSRYWKEDFAEDEAGRLPPDLSRGVLSEDGLYDLLQACKALPRRSKSGLNAPQGKTSS